MSAGGHLFHANLSGMTSEPPHAADSDIHPDFTGKVSDSEASGAQEPLAEHHSQICPNCSHRLASHRCKLICAHCGYYMSCADYY
jgi:ribosomal protein S27AE